MHRIIVRFFEQRDQFITADALHRLSEQTTAGSARPCAEKFVFERLCIGHLTRKFVCRTQVFNFLQRGRLIIGILALHPGTDDQFKQQVAHAGLDISRRQCRNRFKQALVAFHIQPFFHGLPVLRQQVLRITVQPVGIAVIGHNVRIVDLCIHKNHLNG